MRIVVHQFEIKVAQIGLMSFGDLPFRGSFFGGGALSSLSESKKIGVKDSSGPLIRLRSKPDCITTGIQEDFKLRCTFSYRQ